MYFSRDFSGGKPCAGIHGSNLGMSILCIHLSLPETKQERA